MNSDDGALSPFERKLQEKLKQRGMVQSAVPTMQNAQPTTPPPAANPSVPDEDIPEVDPLSEMQQTIDEAIDKINILDAVRRWGKEQQLNVASGQRESIMIRCPNPGHEDSNPSAWVNLDKGKGGVYHCGKCAIGGDKYDIAAGYLGFDIPGYRSHGNTQMNVVAKFMAMELGVQFVQSVTGATYAVSPGSGSEDPAEAQGSDESQAQLEVPTANQEDAPAEELPAQGNPVAQLPSAIAAEQDEEDYAKYHTGVQLDWRNIVPENTFLYEYINACSIDTSPEEYHFWTGMMALGFAIGRNKQLADLRPVNGNIFVCLVGPSSAGKTRASYHMIDLLDKALPFDPNSYSGVDIMEQPASGEVIVANFDASEDDPANPGVQLHYPIRGLVRFDEMSTLIKVAGRHGSTLGTTLMSLYDAPNKLESNSRTGGKLQAREPFGQCLSTIQNMSLNRLMSKDDIDSGFMNRWVFASGMLKPRVAIGGESVRLDYPAELLTQIHMWAFTPTRMDMDDDALELWTQFFNDTLSLDQEAAEKNGSALLGRLDLLMKKLILLFTANLMMNKVPKFAVEQAIKVYGYLLESFAVVGAQLDRTVNKDIEDKIIGAVKKLVKANPTKPPTSNEIYKVIQGHVDSAKQMEEFLRPMVKLGILVEVPPVPTGKRGRPRGMQYAVGS